MYDYLRGYRTFSVAHPYITLYIQGWGPGKPTNQSINHQIYKNQIDLSKGEELDINFIIKYTLCLSENKRQTKLIHLKKML